MDGIEILILLVAIAVTGLFLFKWYKSIVLAWPREYRIQEKAVLSALPVVSGFGILVVLSNWASHDVVSSPSFIFFYLVMGFACMYLGQLMMSALCDLSWRDDIIHGGNKSALFAFCGGFVGITAIYAASNIGNGPGWWTVVFASGLGLIAWVVLAWILHAVTHIFERITVERDTFCGIRVGFFFLASGLILGRASAGDWTSASMTVVEFGAGWPVLILAAIAIFVERFYIKSAVNDDMYNHSSTTHIVIGLSYVVFAVVSIMLLPSLPVNPLWAV